MKFIYTITDFSSCGLPAPLSNVHNSLSYCYWMRVTKMTRHQVPLLLLKPSFVKLYLLDLLLVCEIRHLYCVLKFSAKISQFDWLMMLGQGCQNGMGPKYEAPMRKTVHSVQSVVWSVTHLVAGVTHTHSVSSHGEVPGERFRRRFLVRVRVHVLTLRQDSEIHHKFHHRLSNGKVININVQINKWTVRHELSMWVKIVVFSSSFVQKDVHITFSKETKGKWNVSE